MSKHVYIDPRDRFLRLTNELTVGADHVSMIYKFPPGKHENVCGDKGGFQIVFEGALASHFIACDDSPQYDAINDFVKSLHR